VISYLGFNQLKAQFTSNFEVIGFPCPDFYDQEPGENNEILNCLKYVRPGNGFVPNFPLMSKTDVNGANQHPLYGWMKDRCGPSSNIFTDQPFISWSPVRVDDITWNFEKFLFDSTGQPFRRYAPGVVPQAIIPDIQRLLAKKHDE